MKNSILPPIGLGLYQFNDEILLEQTLEDAILLGYRLFDTARLYQNEHILGRVIKRSGLPRKDFTIISKVWIDQAGEQKAEESLLTSLEQLDTDYLDYALIHQPYNDYYGTWRAINKLKREKKIFQGGVSNFSEERLYDFCLHQTEKPVIHQIECHVFYQRKELRELMKKQQIACQAWAPLARLRGDILSHPSLLRLAQELDLTVAQLCLAFLVNQEVSLVVKSQNKEHLRSNLEAAKIILPETVIQEIELLDQNRSLFAGEQATKRLAYLAARQSK